MSFFQSQWPGMALRYCFQKLTPPFFLQDASSLPSSATCYICKEKFCKKKRPTLQEIDPARRRATCPYNLFYALLRLYNLHSLLRSLRCAQLCPVDARLSLRLQCRHSPAVARGSQWHHLSSSRLVHCVSEQEQEQGSCSIFALTQD